MKRIIAAVSFFILAITLAGCRPPAALPGTESVSGRSEGAETVGYKLAICMGSVNHPVHRVAQLGFMEGAAAAGYGDVLISGLDMGSLQELLIKWDEDITENDILGDLFPAAALLGPFVHNANCLSMQAGIY